ncbi:biotin-dependent carboxyltransferase family protein [Brevibacterium linens]|uniref:5-oxoprolinase subunit C family protein n=1 Tax=Brevibacterium linens TaxID=1703 RepID=UPI0035112CCF
MIEVHSAGISHITDLGRFGHTHVGVQTNGAADRTSARLANILVGNDDSFPVIESLAFFPLRLRTSTSLLISVTGAAKEVYIDGVLLPTEVPIRAWPGAVITVPPAPRGLHSYLGIHGRMGADEFLGSVAFDPLIQRGSRLFDGMDIPMTGHGIDYRLPFPYYPLNFHRPPLLGQITLGVLPGPEYDEFPDSTSRLDDLTFTVGSQSDHVGLRLDGASFIRTTDTEILSRGVPVGAVEAPPNGSLIVLLRGRPLTAGYPVPFVVGRGWHDLLGQLRPGDAVTLQLSTAARSASLAQAELDLIERVRTLCRNAFHATGVFPAA